MWKIIVAFYLISSIVLLYVNDLPSFLSAKPHMAGTVAEQMTAQWVHDTWQQQGLDEVHLTPYRVLLSYPDTDKPNLVS